MAKKMTFTEAQVQEIVAKALVDARKEWEKKQKPSSAGKGKVKDTPFTKRDGTVVMTTAAQAAVWEKRRDSFANKEANLQAWEEKRKAWKPTQAFINAVKANPTMSVKQAKEFGFVGTSNDLWNFKHGTKGIITHHDYNK